MREKKNMTANQAANELAKIALKSLSRFSEEEQEARIRAAERRVAKACRKPSSSNAR